MSYTSRRRAMALLAAMGCAEIPGIARAEDSAEWARVTEAAKKEGKLVVYTAAAGQAAHQRVGKAFEKRFGIEVTFLQGRASEIRERLRTEQAAGRFICDVSHNGSTTSSLQEIEGTFQPFGALPSLGALREPFNVPNKTRLPVFASAYSILVNTNLVKPAEEPRSWADLTNPRWKGKILSDDPRALGGGQVAFFVLYDKLGRSYHEKMAANLPVYTRDQRAAERRVARGDYQVWIPMTFSAYPALKGLPVKILQPEEGYPYITYEVALVKNAPRPNAARLFMNFFLSDEAQLIQDEEGSTMVTRTLAPAATADANARRNGKLLGTTDASRQEQMLKIAQDIYK